ncbi:MAG: trimethylamine methyltransferase family protein, partial [Candidatus Adiutrix sp.]|nr:trimethylamine methyltransferase family protein [Candidatus Adiutrix sp.]
MLPVLSVLTKDEIMKIHEASLQVLAKTGVLLSHPKAQETLAAKGAKISDDQKRVFMPRDFIEKMLKPA